MQKCIICANFFFCFCLAVTKGEEVQITMVKHFRIGLDENYEISEKWFLDDLEMIDGKEADTVRTAFYYKASLYCSLWCNLWNEMLTQEVIMLKLHHEISGWIFCSISILWLLHIKLCLPKPLSSPFQFYEPYPISSSNKKNHLSLKAFHVLSSSKMCGNYSLI